MPAKSISMSLRLSPEEASMLASLRLDGATTPSDKIRTLIRLAEQATPPGRAYADHLGYHQEQLDEVATAVLSAEAEDGRHSELLSYIGRWLPEMLAFYSSGSPKADDHDLGETLEKLEKGVADRAFLLFEYILRLGVTGQSPCYDEDLIIARARTVTALAALISDHLVKKEDTHG